MTETEYILCKWKERWWPAKVLSRSCTSRRRLVPKDKSASVRVEIICLNKQANVRCADTEILKKESIEDISSKLVQSKKCHSPVAELTYRRALREALDILSQGAPSKGETPSKASRGKPPTRKDTRERPLSSLMATRQRLSSQKDPREKKSGANSVGISTPLQAAQIEDECCRCSRERTRAPSKHKTLSKSQDLLGGEGLTGRHNGVSRAKVPVTPLKERKPLPKPGTDRKSPRSLKKAGRPHRVKGKSSGESHSPSPACKHLARTSTPTRVSRRSCTRLTPVGQKSGTRPGLRSNLLCSPAVCVLTEPATDLSEGEVSPPRKYCKVSDGSRCPVGLKGSCWKRRGRSRLKDLNSRPSPDRLLLEHEGEGKQSMLGDKEELSQHQGFEDEEGLESTSDLFLRLSPVREISLCPAFRDDEEEEEELPSFLLHQEPCSFKPGMLVWCKLPRFPYWPAVVKMVRKKAKKANVVLIQKDVNDGPKGFSTSLRNLKHFDCEEKQKLIDKAAENFNHEINWCIKLIVDYRIRVGCHSFTGSFLEYCVDDISSPVRKEAPDPQSPAAFAGAAEETSQEPLSGASQEPLSGASQEPLSGASQEPPSEARPTKLAKKVLPDRMRAARNRANERIVDFIVKAKGADAHLQSILGSTKPSRWLRKFLDGQHFLTSIETYLEDDSQQDLVFDYLQEVYRVADAKASPLVIGDSLKFILEVLFPEAIIYAISAVDHIDYKKAEEKYIQGPRVTQREKEIFEEKIREEKRKQRLLSVRLSPEDNP